jgi:hypothetical protein
MPCLASVATDLPLRIEGIAMMVSQTGGEHHKNGNGILKRSH